MPVPPGIEKDFFVAVPDNLHARLNLDHRRRRNETYRRRGNDYTRWRRRDDFHAYLRRRRCTEREQKQPNDMKVTHGTLLIDVSQPWSKDPANSRLRSLRRLR
jgi:hypothetical protein